jgi:DNA-binding MarR family transcriptional regulator
MIDKTRLQNRILELASQSSTGLSAQLTVEFGISRQTLHRHLKNMITRGLIEGSGTTSGREYHLAVLEQETKEYETAGLSEDLVWRDFFATRFRDSLDNVRAIWQYGITEMVNNAIDHSGSAVITVGLRRNALYTDAWVADEGEGIFRKIQNALGLYDPREAILELVKGKLTTDPKRHTGEAYSSHQKYLTDSTSYRALCISCTMESRLIPCWNGP